MAQSKEPAWVTKADRMSIGAVAIGALLVAAGLLVSFAVTTATQLVSGEMTFPVLTGAAVPAGEFGAENGLVAATYTEASVTASGLSAFPVAAFITAHAVDTLTGVIVALALAFMGWRLLKGDPFRKSVLYSAWSPPAHSSSGRSSHCSPPARPPPGRCSRSPDRATAAPS